MEYAREIKIVVEIDTNKQTIRKEFSSFEDLLEWIEEQDEDSLVGQLTNSPG